MFQYYQRVRHIISQIQVSQNYVLEGFGKPESRIMKGLQRLIFNNVNDSEFQTSLTKH